MNILLLFFEKKMAPSHAIRHRMCYDNFCKTHVTLQVVYLIINQFYTIFSFSNIQVWYCPLSWATTSSRIFFNSITCLPIFISLYLDSEASDASCWATSWSWISIIVKRNNNNLDKVRSFKTKENTWSKSNWVCFIVHRAISGRRNWTSSCVFCRAIRFCCSYYFCNISNNTFIITFLSIKAEVISLNRLF